MSRFKARESSPEVDPSATIAPTAVLSGDVTVGPRAHISFGAVILGDDGPVTIGEQTVVRENVVVRASTTHPVEIGSFVLVGAGSALYGCTIDDEAFLATGVTVLHGARVGRRAEVRINAVVHVNTAVPPQTTVPIGWVAVGDPAKILPPGDHDEIWRIQSTLDFPGTAYGIEREPDGSVDMRAVTDKAVGTRAKGFWRKLDD